MNKILQTTNNNNNKYKECIKKNEKPLNFYFNEENKDFRPCYETCSTCYYGGDAYEHNCTSCEINYILKPDITDSTNCVIKCPFYYFYNSLEQYKCTPSYTRPQDFNLLIKEKGKCINNCENDNIYKYQYNDKCYKECPNITYHEDNEYKCKDINTN